jgi:hypothetical protein
LPPTKVSDFYSLNHPLGRGYIFQNGRVKMMDASLQLLPSYTDEVREALLDENKILTSQKISEYLNNKEILKEAQTHLPLVDQQNVGVPLSL